MARGRVVVREFWVSDWSLSALLALLVIDSFVLGPIIELQRLPDVIQPLLFTLILVSGVAMTLRRRSVTVLVATLAVVDFAIRWTSHVHRSVALLSADAFLSMLFAAMLTTVILVQVFRPGPMNMHRIRGAIAAYLLIAFTLAFAYKLVALLDPNAFNFPIGSLTSQQLLVRLAYFSTTTLTTVGFGDILPVNPVARSLASLEALIGQIFPAVLLARLVAMEIYERQHSGHH
jgi:hypothetical protein